MMTPGRTRSSRSRTRRRSRAELRADRNDHGPAELRTDRNDHGPAELRAGHSDHSPAEHRAGHSHHVPTAFAPSGHGLSTPLRSSGPRPAPRCRYPKAGPSPRDDNPHAVAVAKPGAVRRQISRAVPRETRTVLHQRLTTGAMHTSVGHRGGRRSPPALKPTEPPTPPAGSPGDDTPSSPRSPGELVSRHQPARGAPVAIGPRPIAPSRHGRTSAPHGPRRPRVRRTGHAYAARAPSVRGRPSPEVEPLRRTAAVWSCTHPLAVIRRRTIDTAGGGATPVACPRQLEASAGVSAMCPSVVHLRPTTCAYSACPDAVRSFLTTHGWASARWSRQAHTTAAARSSGISPRHVPGRPLPAQRGVAEAHEVQSAGALARGCAASSTAPSKTAACLRTRRLGSRCINAVSSRGTVQSDVAPCSTEVDRQNPIPTMVPGAHHPTRSGRSARCRTWIRRRGSKRRPSTQKSSRVANVHCPLLPLAVDRPPPGQA